ncbi:MAG: hypothetical protein ACP5NX_01130 [Candidatus Bilamarchaeaceae archaeon]
MADEISYPMLREMQRKESESAEIVKVDPEFYKRVSRFLEDRKVEVLKSSSMLKIKEYENLKHIVRSLQLRREEKIVLSAIRGDRDASERLAEEERVLLQSLTKAVAQGRDAIGSLFAEDVAEPRFKKVRIIKDISPYKGLDSNTYGPFRAGDEPILPKEEADWLMKEKFAEI